MLIFSKNKAPEEDGFPEFNLYFSFIKNIGVGDFGKLVVAESLETKEKVVVKVTISSKTLISLKCIRILDATHQSIIQDKVSSIIKLTDCPNVATIKNVKLYNIKDEFLVYTN